MYGLTLLDKFKSLDIYGKLPSDFAQPTYPGLLSKFKKKIYNIQ